MYRLGALGLNWFSNLLLDYSASSRIIRVGLLELQLKFHRRTFASNFKQVANLPRQLSLLPSAGWEMSSSLRATW